MINRIPSHRAKRLGSLTDMLRSSRKDDVISFAGDLPEEQMMPLEEIRLAAERIASFGDRMPQSVPIEGLLLLREQISNYMSRKGILADTAEIVLTAEPAETLRLLAKVMLEPGDSVLVEAPTDPDILRIMKSNGAKVHPVAGDREGMLISEVEQLILEHRPKLIHVMPALGNPEPKAWSMPRREALLALSRQYGVVILENDPYGDLLYDKSAPYSSLYAMDQKSAGGSVIYTSTFAAAIAPELRTSWFIAGRSVTTKLHAAETKENKDAGIRRDQETLLQFMLQTDIEAYLRKVSLSYMERMNRLQALLQQQEWSGAAWTQPKGGRLLWLELPEGIDAEALLRSASAKGVTFDSGLAFYAETPPSNRVRLNIAHMTGERLEEGVARFAAAVNEFLARS